MMTDLQTHHFEISFDVDGKVFDPVMWIGEASNLLIFYAKTSHDLPLILFSTRFRHGFALESEIE